MKNYCILVNRDTDEIFEIEIRFDCKIETTSIINRIEMLNYLAMTVQTTKD